ncbi:hypothetical protein Sarmat_00201 [Rickettsiales endosymbiont of Paramecium tredecaurelia]|nr:hypothetical protein [Candidatus Sarmatiella mevalonica]
MLSLKTSRIDQRFAIDLFVCILLCNLLVSSYATQFLFLWADKRAPSAYRPLEWILPFLPMLSILCACVGSWYFVRLATTSVSAQQVLAFLARKAKLSFTVILMLCICFILVFVIKYFVHVKPELCNAFTRFFVMQSNFRVIDGPASLILLLQLFLVPGAQISRGLYVARMSYLTIELLFPPVIKFVLPMLWLDGFTLSVTGCSLDNAISTFTTLIFYIVMLYIMIFSYKSSRYYLSHNIKNGMKCYALYVFSLLITTMILCWTGLFLTSFYMQMLNV